MTEENIYTNENTTEKSVENTEKPAEQDASVSFSAQKEDFEENSAPQAENEMKQETQGFTEPAKVTYTTYIPYGFTPETFEERKKIKTAAKTIGAAFLGMTFVVLLLNLAVIIASYVLDVSLARYLFEPAVLQVEQILFSILSLFVVFLYVFNCSEHKIGGLISFKLPKFKKATVLFMFGISFCAFSNIASTVVERIISSFNIDYEVNFPENPKGIFGFLLVVLSTIVVPSLAEEFACRGLVLGLLRKFGDGFAIVVSAVLFGLMHGNFEQMPFATLVGLVLGYVTVKSGSIWVAVAIHAFNNSISVLVEYGLGSFSQQAQNVAVVMIFVLCMLAGIISFLLQGEEEKELFVLDKSNTKASEKQKYKWFFMSAPILIYVIICLLEAVSFFVM